MVRLLVDTSVWFDLAKRRDGQRWIVPIRVLTQRGKLELLVPSVVIAEFERNRPRAEAAVTSSVLDRFVRSAKISTSSPGISAWSGWKRWPIAYRWFPAGLSGNFAEIKELLDTGTQLVPGIVETDAAMNRGLEKRAPFPPQQVFSSPEGHYFLSGFIGYLVKFNVIFTLNDSIDGG